MQFLRRLNFQNKINLVTFFMVALVVVAGGVAIDRVVLPAMARELQDEAWRIAGGIHDQIQAFPDKNQEAQLKERLSIIFRVRAKLLYVELFDSSGQASSWMGDEQYRAIKEARLIDEKDAGSLSQGRSAANDPIYEIILFQSAEPAARGLPAVRVGVSAKSLQRFSGQLFRILFTVALLILGASYFITRWFTHMITRPVNQLLHMAQLLAEGRLDDVTEGVQEALPCWRLLQESSFVGMERVPEFCPLLTGEVGPHKVGPTGIGKAPCNSCESSRYVSGDELSRLLLAFHYMAARISCYQKELKQRYEFEERLCAACPDGIMANDRLGRIILYNEGAERLLGYEAGEVLNKLHVQQLYRPGEAHAIKKALLSDEYGGPGILLDYTTELVRKDGQGIPIRLSATILYKEGEEMAVVGYFHDLTELNEHMNALMEANNRLNEANQELALLNRRYLEMLSFVTHELKSPIANSYMSANALRQEIFGTLASEQAIMVEAICRNLDQSMEMIRHYLDLSRIEKDEMPVQPQATSMLAEVVEPVLKGLASAILEKDAAIVVDVPPDLVWNLDPELFRGVFTNLVSNAIKYGEKSGKIRIAIADLGSRCRMEVWNSGPGIHKEDLGRLFQKFQRLDNARQSSVRGTGLGLFITKTVVERHGGKIYVDSRKGEGVSFIIELPRV